MDRRLNPLAAILGGATDLVRHPISAYRRPAELAEGRTIDMCAGCDVDCCSYIVPLTVSDAHRIQQQLNLPWTAFATLVPYPTRAVTWPIRVGRRNFQLAIKRKRGTCPFRMRFSGLQRCGIHPLRPMACRLFPFLADVDAQRRAPSSMMAQLPPEKCPLAWPKNDTSVAELHDLIVTATTGRAQDEEVLRLWNLQLDLPRTRENFFLFLEEEMARRARGEAGRGRWRTALW
jgi:Fe-S-cluster containining protein